MKAKIERIEYDPNRSAYVALIKYEDGLMNYIIAPNKIKSPPPIPSLLYIALKTKFTNQSEEYPIKKPKEENWIGFKLNK